MTRRNKANGKVSTPQFNSDSSVLISEIRIGARHRKDMGDIETLAESIRREGLLQPIGVTDKRELVFGARRLIAVRDVLKQRYISVRTVNVTSIVEGEYHENEVRKDFTPSERVAIEREINSAIERQRPGRRGKDCQNFGRICDRSAFLAGFGNRETARQARKVVEQGAPELIEAMDRHQVAISTAAEIANLPKDQQVKRLKQLCESASDGKHHSNLSPEEKEKLHLWDTLKKAIWPISEFTVDAREAVAAVPQHNRDVFAQRLERSGVIIQVLKVELRKYYV